MAEKRPKPLIPSCLAWKKEEARKTRREIAPKLEALGVFAEIGKLFVIKKPMYRKICKANNPSRRG